MPGVVIARNPFICSTVWKKLFGASPWKTMLVAFPFVKLANPPVLVLNAPLRQSGKQMLVVENVPVGPLAPATSESPCDRLPMLLLGK